MYAEYGTAGLADVSICTRDWGPVAAAVSASGDKCGSPPAGACRRRRACRDCGLLFRERQHDRSQVHALHHSLLAIAMKPRAFAVMCRHDFLRVMNRSCLTIDSSEPNALSAIAQAV